MPDDLSKAFCHFRILNHRMPIEWGRFLGISRDDRICELCFHNKIGDEYHYLIECSYFSSDFIWDFGNLPFFYIWENMRSKLGK